MYQLKLHELTKDGFQKYGEYQDLLDDQSLAAKSVNPSGFFPDVLYMDWGGHTPATVSVCQAASESKMVVNFIEAHRYTHEGLLPIDGDVAIYVGSAPRGDIQQSSAKDLQCFRVPKGTYVKLYPHTLHGRQFSLEEKQVHVLCQLPVRTFANDMMFVIIDDEARQGEIIR